MRLFVAVPLPTDVQQSLGRLQGGIPGARWTRPENMHLTLRFLGDVSERDAHHVDDALDAIDEGAFEMALSGVGVFESRHGPRALWIGVEPNPPLMHLQDKVERAIQMLGYPPEPRKFTPHITLARFKSRPGRKIGDFIEAHGLYRTGHFAVESFTLFQSLTGNEAPHYIPLAEYDLLGNAGVGADAGSAVARA